MIKAYEIVKDTEIVNREGLLFFLNYFIHFSVITLGLRTMQ